MSDESRPIENTEDVIDSRDVIARIDYLKASWADATEEDPGDFALSEDDWAAGLGSEEAHELVALLALAEEGEGLADWQYGEALIRDSYFEDYARDLAEEIGAVDPNASWPNTYIDWERAADALLIDYTEVDFDGVTYYGRS